MITIEDVPELVAGWQAGDFYADEVYHRCVALFASHPVERVLALLPPELRQRFVEAMSEDFDNDSPPDDYVSFSGYGDEATKTLVIDRIREYLAAVVKGG